jgi:predicted secreted hydrolase
MKAILLVAVLIILNACDSGAPAGQQTQSISVSRAMQASPDAGFQRAEVIRGFKFPADHGAHPEFATEWWYFTGNLESSSGDAVGYQLTLFRLGMKSAAVKDVSAWRTHQLYMGHLAVSDINNSKHYSEERFSRAAAGLAGAETFPLKVWLGSWSITGARDGLFPIKLSAENKEIAIDLTLKDSAKPVTLQGDRGLSQKSAAVGNASYYYSFTRLPSEGIIRIRNRKLSVTGNSWFDREWSSSALAVDQQGWDWFSLQLDDNREIMFYQLRDKQGHAQKFSDGVLVDSKGHTQKLNLDNTQLKPLSTWTNAQGVSYPVSWSITIPQHNIDLRVDAAFNDQEMRHSVHYWEGAVIVSGSHAGKGYLELSGYEK